MTEKKCKTKKARADDEIEKICMKEFNFSISELNELHDILEECDGLIAYHMDMTSSISETTKKRMMNMMLKRDTASIDVNELYLESMKFMLAAKRKHLLDEEIKIDKKQTEEFSKKLNVVRQNIRDILTALKEYMKEIDEISTRGLVV